MTEYSRGFRENEHTADWALEVWAPDFPGIIEQFWLLGNLSGFLIWGIPIEELGFYFAAGAFIAPLYEFLFEKKLVKLS